MAKLSSSDSIYVLRGVQAFKSKQVQVAKNCQSRSYRRQVILVPTDTMGGAPSRVWRLEKNILLPNTSAILKLDPFYDKRDRLLRVGGRLQYSRTYLRVPNIQLSYRMGIQWLKRWYRVCMRSCFMLDQRVPFRSYNKRFGSPRDVVNLREFRENTLFVNINASAHVHKRWHHCRQRGCYRLLPSHTSE